MKKIGVLTSGGDAPGMNAAIRAVTRAAIHFDVEVVGILRGYAGLINGEFEPLTSRSVGNIIQRGGTILKSERSKEFMTEEGRRKAHKQLIDAGLDGLVLIGGDGTFTGGLILQEETGFPCVGIPGTIDNDIPGTQTTIGFDTALNTALEAIDRIRDTANSHDRIFIVEVMGRDSGFLAIEVGVAAGAEQVFIPENPVSVDEAISHVKAGIAQGKKSHILIAAEGRKPGRAYDLAEAIRKKANMEARVCILGHIQRGGAPTARDRILASEMGALSVEALVKGVHGYMACQTPDGTRMLPFKDHLGQKRNVSLQLTRLAKALSH